MDIESFIQTSLQINLLGKKLKNNNSLIIGVSLIDEGSYEYDWCVYVHTEDGCSSRYNLTDSIELAD